MPLVTAHPGQVGTLVAHEPPVVELLTQRVRGQMHQHHGRGLGVHAGEEVRDARVRVPSGAAAVSRRGLEMALSPRFRARPGRAALLLTPGSITRCG